MNSVYRCACIGSFKAAKRYFTDNPPVRSKRWKLNERPLYESRHNYFKLAEYKAAEGMGDDYYDLILYDTPVVRYYKPNALDEEVVLLRNTYQRTTWQFLVQHGWRTWFDKTQTSDGKEVFIPLSIRATSAYNDVPEGWSAKLVFNKDGKLLLAKSAHRPVGTHVSTPEDKARRKAMLEKADTLIELMVLRLPSFHEKRTVDYQHGRAFPYLGFRHSDVKQARNEVADALDKLVAGKDLPDDALPHVLTACQRAYNVVISRQWVKAGGYSVMSQPEQTDMPPISADAFRKSLKSLFVRLAELDTARGLKQLPFFPEKLPRTWKSL